MCNQGSSCCWWIIIAIIILFLLCGNCGSWGCGCGNNSNNTPFINSPNTERRVGESSTS